MRKQNEKPEVEPWGLVGAVVLGFAALWLIAIAVLILILFLSPQSGGAVT